MLPQSEAEFQKAVEDYLTVLGYLHFAVRNSWRRVSARGFPDICAVHQSTGALVFIELKSAGGRTSPAQEAWLAALGKFRDRSTGPFEAFVMRPEHFEAAKVRLAALAGRKVT